MKVTVIQKYIRTSPRKLRLVGDLIRGWQVEKAINQLRFIPKAATQDITKALKSAIASAKEKNLNSESLYIQELRIDEGPSLKRRIYFSRGRAAQVKKRMSHIIVTLSEEKAVNKENQQKAAEVKTETNSNKETKSKSEVKEK